MTMMQSPGKFTGTIHIPLATNPLSLNKISSMHWATKAKLVKQWRTFAALNANRWPYLGRCDVSLTWYVTTSRIRDEDNMSLLLKSLCDGLVDAGVTLDDDPEHMGKVCRIAAAPASATTAFHELRVVQR